MAAPEAPGKGSGQGCELTIARADRWAACQGRPFSRYPSSAPEEIGDIHG